MANIDDNAYNFIKNNNCASQKDVCLLLFYFAETLRGKEWLSVPELKQLFLESRTATPGNISAVVSKAVDSGYLITNTSEILLCFKLSIKGINFVESLVSSKETRNEDEETRILEDISLSLYKSLDKITDLDERGYIQEALTCLVPSIKAYRAAIIMGWTGTIYHLRKMVEKSGFGLFCSEFEKLSSGKTKKVNNIDDLEYYQEKEFLLVIEKMGLFDKAVKQQLDNCLVLRNACGHPTQVKPQIHRVKSFFEDIIQYVLVR
jgi:hypothetical protein